MTPQEMIEEAHGLWEIAIVRLAAFIEVRATEQVRDAALAAERKAFAHWQEVSHKVLTR